MPRPQTDQPPKTEQSRRDFVTSAALVFSAVGGAMVLWPFFDHMNPNPGTPAPPTVEVDLPAIAPGTTKLVNWNATPVFVRHRTIEQIERMRAIPITALIDAYARNDALPATTLAHDAARVDARTPAWVVIVGICPHSGCVLRVTEPGQGQRDNEGWHCPCCAARFDIAGRVQSGPSPTNLRVPRLTFETPARLRIG